MSLWPLEVAWPNVVGRVASTSLPMQLAQVSIAATPLEPVTSRAFLATQ